MSGNNTIRSGKLFKNAHQNNFENSPEGALNRIIFTLKLIGQRFEGSEKWGAYSHDSKGWVKVKGVV